MKSIILSCAIVAMAGTLSIAHAEDFYSVNETLLAANQLDTVKKNSLLELGAHRDSIEANYFLALVTIRQNSNIDPSRIYTNNSYTDQFQALYRDHANAAHLMYGDQIMVSDIRFVKLFYYLGLKYLSQQDFQKAVEWLNLAEIGYSDKPNFDFNFEIGTSYYAIKNYDKARKYFEAALKIKPDHTDALYNMACLYSVMNKPDESIKWLAKVINRDPKYKAIAAKDSDFDSIRKTEKYQRLITEVIK